VTITPRRYDAFYFLPNRIFANRITFSSCEGWSAVESINSFAGLDLDILRRDHWTWSDRASWLAHVPHPPRSALVVVDEQLVGEGAAFFHVPGGLGARCRLGRARSGLSMTGAAAAEGLAVARCGADVPRALQTNQFFPPLAWGEAPSGAARLADR